MKGSPGMAGAASLSSLATLRAGAGIVRLFHPEGLEKELVAAPYEIIKEPFHIDRFLVEAKRAKALFIGPGMGRTDEEGFGPFRLHKKPMDMKHS